MHIVLLAGHSREHILSENSTASMLFTDYMNNAYYVCLYMLMCASYSFQAAAVKRLWEVFVGGLGCCSCHMCVCVSVSWVSFSVGVCMCVAC